MSSLSDQLLKAGLVTQEQVTKAAEKPKKKKHITKSRPNSKTKPATKQKNAKKKSEPSDLAQFYAERKQLENKEKQQEAHRKKEAARIKKENKQKIDKLISANLLNDDKAEIRFNFVVGTSIKYVFVTEKQQQELIEGKLAFTFMGSKRCLVSLAIAQEIRVIDPQKIVISP
ncbi:MAG: DUF2058 family protein [Cocleimonas sp.]